jgi:outer membrane protein assembly factor BamD (BamD/ComL family)
VRASDLAAQNDLFAEAMDARRRGDVATAIQKLDRLLAKYPSSPLVEHAMAERMKTLRGIDHGRASAAARDYLARFPRGVARKEAEDILGVHEP